MERANYTPEQRTEALRLYAEAGPAEASRCTGIKRATISKWASRNGMSAERAERTRRATEAARQSYAEGRATRSAALAQEVDALIERLRDANPTNAAHLARAIHLLIQDAAVEANEPESQTDRENHTAEEFDRRVEQLVRTVREDALEYVRRELGLKEIPEHIRVAVLEGRAKEVRRHPPVAEPQVAAKSEENGANRGEHTHAVAQSGASESDAPAAELVPASPRVNGTGLNALDSEPKQNPSRSLPSDGVVLMLRSR
jgi:hypothetical protein